MYYSVMSKKVNNDKSYEVLIRKKRVMYEVILYDEVKKEFIIFNP